MDSELDRTLNQWDNLSCAEFEAFLDEMHDEEMEEVWAEERIVHLEAEWEKERGLGEF